MKKNIFIKALLLALVLLTVLGAVNVAAFEPYDTYTYSIDGEALKSPTAYSVYNSYVSADMGITGGEFGDTPLAASSDLFTDEDGNVYIADTGNDRIVVLDKYFRMSGVLQSYTDENGKVQKLSKPEGLYVTDSRVMVDGSSRIYVCDTGNKRIVIFNRQTLAYEKTIEKPSDNVLASSAFVPTAIAVDLYGRIFIVSTQCYEGVIVMSENGGFTGFIGAQKVTYNIIEMIWRKFQSKEQQQASIRNISVSYNNITVDKNGFIYVTSDKVDKAKQLAAIKSKGATYSPVKKLNSAGAQIMKRNGFFDPGGEVDVFEASEVSTIIDIAIGSEYSWTIVDSKRSRFFTYDQNGNLLFAYGDTGDQLGNAEKLVSISYQVINGVYYFVTLDNAVTGYKITVYTPTEYCNTIMSALANENAHNYSESIAYWQDVLTRNNNFDLAYIGIGKALYSQGKYEEAMDMLSNAYETKYYSDAFSQTRKDVLQKWLLLILVGVIALIVLIAKFFGYAKRKNKATSLKVGKKTYWEELVYAFHLIFHPFDGFWDLKHEKRGSLRAAFTILGITVLAFFYQAVGRGYIFNPKDNYSTVFVQLIAVIVPVFLWAVANWCLTTLFDGEGSFRDIIIATCYSLAPLPAFVILSTVLTNILTTSEGSIVNLLVVLGYIWVGYLLFFGMLVTHDYSLGKNFVITIFTIVAMAVIMFVAMLFSNLVIQMVTFIASIFTEIGNRI